MEKKKKKPLSNSLTIKAIKVVLLRHEKSKGDQGEGTSTPGKRNRMRKEKEVYKQIMEHLVVGKNTHTSGRNSAS